MKKLISLCAAAATVAACTGIFPTKVENVTESCNCLICEACDSLTYYAALDSIARDSTWILEHSDNFYQWSDSLTALVYGYLNSEKRSFIDYPVEDLLNNEKFMSVMEKGYDGLYTLEDSTGCIAYFYGAYVHSNR